MPHLKRRSFLQMIGAASVAPALPSIPAGATAAARTGSHSQMLWASVHARAGSAAKCVGVAKSWGISAHAAQGVMAKMGYSTAFAVQGATRLSRSTPSVAAPLTRRSGAPKLRARSLKRNLERFIPEDESVPDHATELVDDSVADDENI